MKRAVIGILLLAILLLGGIFSSAWLVRSFDPLIPLLERSGLEAREGNWDTAGQLAHQAQARWQEAWKLTAVFVDHAPMEQIDGLFSQLETFRQARCPVEFAALCLRLAQELEALGQTHSPEWWNLL